MEPEGSCARSNQALESPCHLRASGSVIEIPVKELRGFEARRGKGSWWTSCDMGYLAMGPELRVEDLSSSRGSGYVYMHPAGAYVG